MANENSKIDENHRHSLLGVTDNVAAELRRLLVDPTTGALKCTAIISGTVSVANGGTGLSSLTPYALLAGGTTATGLMQQVSGLGNSGQFLKSNGAGTLPSWDTVSTVYARAATKVVAANDSLDKTNADYVCDGVDDQVQIQAAIDAISAVGGGLVMLNAGTYTVALPAVTNGTGAISLANNVILSGQGSGTIIKIKDTWATSATYIASVIYFPAVSYARVQNFKIDGNASNQTLSAIELLVGIGACDHCKVTNLELASTHRGEGIRIIGNCQFQEISNNYIHDMTRDAILVKASAPAYVQISNNFTDTVSNGGIEFDASGGGRYFSITNNIFKDGTDGIYVGGVLFGSVISGNIGYSNSQIGCVYLSSTGTNYNQITGNISYDSQYGYRVQDIAGSYPKYNSFVGNTSFNASVADFMDDGVLNTWVGNSGTGSDPTTDRIIKRMKNTSGGSLAVGDVVVLKSVAAGNEVTTTTTGGDVKVFGVVGEIIANNDYGQILIVGKTTSLKVNGTDDIAIGDLLSTYTEAGIAKKALPGETTFAIALEAYTGDDSNGVIDALLIRNI